MQFNSVGQTIGFCRLPAPHSGAKARFAHAGRPRKTTVFPRKAAKYTSLFVTQTTGTAGPLVVTWICIILLVQAAETNKSRANPMGTARAIK